MKQSKAKRGPRRALTRKCYDGALMRVARFLAMSCVVDELANEIITDMFDGGTVDLATPRDITMYFGAGTLFRNGETVGRLDGLTVTVIKGDDDDQTAS